jgi:hypothetical protein
VVSVILLSILRTVKFKMTTVAFNVVKDSTLVLPDLVLNLNQDV